MKNRPRKPNGVSMSAVRRIERIIRQGWQPGERYRDYLGTKSRKGVGRHE